MAGLGSRHIPWPPIIVILPPSPKLLFDHTTVGVVKKSLSSHPLGLLDMYCKTDITVFWSVITLYCLFCCQLRKLSVNISNWDNIRLFNLPKNDWLSKTLPCSLYLLFTCTSSMSQVKAPIVKEADPSADKSIWQDGEESLDEEVIISSLLCLS